MSRQDEPTQSDALGAQPTRVRYLVLLGLCLAAAISYISRHSLSIVEKQVRLDLELTERQMGLVFGSFTLAYALLQVPGGWWIQRVGSRRALTWFAAAWSVATAALGLAQGMILLCGVRWLKGMAQAGLFAGCANTISHWFPRSRHGVSNGVLTSFMAAGGAVGAMATGVLATYLGWRLTMVLYGLVGLVWCWVFYRWFRDTPGEVPEVNEAERELIAGMEGPPPARAVDELVPWALLLASPALWWICSQQFFRAAANMFFTSWFPTYLQEARAVSLKTAGMLTSLPLWASVVGGIAGGAASDWVLQRTGSRRWARQGISVAALSVCSVLVFAAYFVESPVAAVLIISCGTFFFALTGSCAYTITIDMGGRHVPTVFAIMNMSGNIGAALFPVLVPEIVERTGNWDLVLPFFACLTASAAACWLMLNPNGTILAPTK